MLDSHARCALVTVAAVRGSAPREAGARMVIEPGGGFRGTIGGGELEWQAIGAAREALSRAVISAALTQVTLGPDLGQCCGGSLRLLIEVFDRTRIGELRALAAREAAGPFITRGRIGPHAVERVSHPWDDPDGGRRGGGAHSHLPVEIEGDGGIVERFREVRCPVWLFGAGHVGRALMLALAPLPFEVTWVDERADAFPAAVPANVRALRSPEPAQEIARAPGGALIVVMTHSHARDLAIVHAALAAGRFGYVGLIGSDSKRARFTRRLRDAGVAKARIAELVCPIGLPGIRSKLPAAIAAGVVAQLLERSEALAASVAPARGAVAGAAR